MGERNPMDLKRGIDMAVDEVVKDIARLAKKVKSSEEIAQVGTVAANGETRDRPDDRQGHAKSRQ